MADKLYLYFLSEGENLFGETKNEEICDLLVATNWNELKPDEIKETRTILEELSNLF